jgi:hypothetical protein
MELDAGMPHQVSDIGEPLGIPYMEERARVSNGPKLPCFTQRARRSGALRGCRAGTSRAGVNLFVDSLLHSANATAVNKG